MAHKRVVQMPLVCHGHTRPIVDLEFRHVTLIAAPSMFSFYALPCSYPLHDGYCNLTSRYLPPSLFAAQ